MHIPKLGPDYLFKKVKEESVLLNIATGDYFGLNEVGTDFCGQIDGKRSLDEIITNLLAVYEVEPEVLRKDIEELAAAMVQKGILTFEPV